MALKRLLTEEMIQISGSWVDPNHPARKAAAGVPQLSAILPHVDAAHAGLLEKQRTPDDPRLAALAAEAVAVDQQHDTTIRGTYSFMSALALLLGAAGDADEAGNIQKLLDTVLPDGLHTTQLSHRAEAGAAELLVKRMAGDASIQQRLEAIPITPGNGAPPKNLAWFVSSWIDSARKLGALENDRAKLVPSTGPGEGSQIVAARNAWIRATNALVANAALAEIDEPTRRLIFGPLDLAEKTADRRVKAPVDAAAATAAAPPPVPVAAK